MSALLVVDVSSNNGWPLDFKAAKAAGVANVIVKITQGGGKSAYVNPDAQAAIAAARAAGFQPGAYHFEDPSVPVSEQVALIKAHADGVRRIFVDSETAAKTWSAEVAATQGTMNGIKAFAATGLYAGNAFLDNMAGAPWGEPLWYPNYPGGYVASDTTPPRPCQMWQWSDNYDVAGIGPCDASWFYGTPAELAAFFNPPELPTPMEADRMRWIDKMPNGDIILTDGASYEVIGAERIAWLKARGVPDYSNDPVKLTAGVVKTLRQLGTTNEI